MESERERTDKLRESDGESEREWTDKLRESDGESEREWRFKHLGFVVRGYSIFS